MAHTAQYHTYIRCEGNTLLRKLPEEARISLRYYETVGSLRPFRPLPPLTSSREVISGKNYYYVAVTDWSLYLLTKDNKVEGSVLLEIPWLGIRELDKTEADSDDFMKQDPKKPDQVIRSVAISISPRADISAVTPAMLRKAGLASGRRQSSPSRTPPLPHPKHPTSTAAGNSGVHAGKTGPEAAGGSCGCCGRGGKVAAAVVQPSAGLTPQSLAQQLNAQNQTPQQFQEQFRQPLSTQTQPIHPSQATPQSPQLLAYAPSQTQAELQAQQLQHISDRQVQQKQQHPQHPQWAAVPDQAMRPLSVDFTAQRIPRGPYPSPHSGQHPGYHRYPGPYAAPSPGQYPSQYPFWKYEFLDYPARNAAAVGLPPVFCPQLREMWGQWHQQQRLNDLHRYSAGMIESYVAKPGVVTYTDPYTGELYDDNWNRGAGFGAYGPGAYPYQTAGAVNPPGQHAHGQQYMAYSLYRMMPGPLGEASEKPSADPAALHLSSTPATAAAATVAAPVMPPASNRRENLFSTLRRRGEDGSTTQANSAITFTRTLPRPRPRDERTGGGGGGGGGAGSLSSSIRAPRKDAELHRAVEAGMRQLEESLRRQPRPQLVVQDAASPPPSSRAGRSRSDGGVGVGVGGIQRLPAAGTAANAASRLSISLRPYLTGAAPMTAMTTSPLGGTMAPTTYSSRGSQEALSPPPLSSEVTSPLQPQLQPNAVVQMPSASSHIASATPSAGIGQQGPSIGGTLAAVARRSSKATSSRLAAASGHAVGDTEDVFPLVTRKGRRSRCLPPEPGNFQLPFYPSCQPLVVSGPSSGGAVDGIGGDAGSVSLPMAVTEPLIRLGEQVLRRQFRARPGTLWEEHERQQAARWVANQRRSGGGGGDSGDAGGGGPALADEYDTAEEEYEDFWVADPADDELSIEDRILSEYQLILVTIERKSNLFFHIQRAWLGAHMRLALTEAAVRGMPLWYAPPFIPRHIVLDIPVVVGGSSGGRTYGQSGQPQMSTELPEIRGPLDATQQALQYFSEPGLLSRGLDSAALSAGAMGALELFPGDSPVLCGLSRTGSHTELDLALSPAPTLEDLSLRMSRVSTMPFAAASRKSLAQLGSLLAATGRGPAVRSPTAAVVQERSSVNWQPSQVPDSSGGGTSAGGGGGGLGGVQDNNVDLSVSVSSAFLTLYDAQRSRRQSRLASALGARDFQALVSPSPSLLPPPPPQPAEAVAAARWRQRAGEMVAARHTASERSDGGQDYGIMQSLSAVNSARSLQMQHQDSGGVVVSASPFANVDSDRRRSPAGVNASRRTLTWHPDVARERLDERPSASSPQLQSLTQPLLSPVLQQPLHHSTSSNLKAAASIAAAANLAAQRYGADVDATEARSFYLDVEEAMRNGCSLFDEGDAKLIQDIILERAFSQTPGARKLSKCFFNSRIVFSFIVSRLYGWGAICAMFSGPTPTRSRSPTKPQRESDSVRRSVRRSMALTGRVRRVGGGDYDASGGGGSRDRHAPTATATVEAVLNGPASKEPGGRRTETAAAAFAARNGSAGGSVSGGKQLPAGSSPIVYSSMPTSASMPTDKSRPQSRGSPTKQEQLFTKTLFAADPRAIYEQRVPTGRATTSSTAVVTDFTHERGPARQATDGGGGGRGREDGARSWWQRGAQQRSPFAGPMAERIDEEDNATSVEAAAAAGGPGVQLQRTSDPRVLAQDFRKSQKPPSPIPDHIRNRNGDEQPKAALSASFNFAMTSIAVSEQPISALAVSRAVSPPSEVPPRMASPEPATVEEAPFKLRPEKNALEKAVELEEELAFFQRLHNNRSWAMFSRSPRRHRHLLRRLGLNPSEPTSIRATVEALAEIVTLQQERAAKRPMGQRSTAPVPSAPPTLNPDPLSLSPLDEAPFLFVLQHQQHYGNGDATDSGGGGAAAASEVLDLLTGRTARAESQVRSSLWSYGDGDIGGGGSSGRRSTMTSGMRSAYLRSYMQHKTEATEELLVGPALEMWARLVGRLAARLAHKRIKRLLYWVQQELAFSEGCEERINWLSDMLVESDPDAPPELDWSFARCSRTLVALVTQLADPNPPDRVAGRYPPEVPPLKPRDATDMMYWIRYEIKSYPLDWSVGILYEMTGLSEEAQALGRYECEDVVLQVLRQLPTELLHQFVRRMFLRLACFVLGYAELYGVARQQSLAALVTSFRYAGVLLGLVRSNRSCADMLADEFFLELYYLFRTQQVQDRLREVRGGKDALLAESTQHLFEGVLQCIGNAAMHHGPGGVAGALSVGQLTNRATFTKMPGRLT